MKTRRRRVLYLDYENPANVISARNTDLRLGLPGSDLIIWDRFGHGTPPKPGEQRLEGFVKDCVAATGHGPWIIFDSWSSLLNPGEGGELTGQTAYKFVELRRLADLGATITVIDHTRKYDRSIVYGGQDKEAKADSIHNLQLYDDNRAHPVVLVRSWLKRNAPRNEGNFAFEVRGERDQKGNWHIRGLLSMASRDSGIKKYFLFRFGARHYEKTVPISVINSVMQMNGFPPRAARPQQVPIQADISTTKETARFLRCLPGFSPDRACQTLLHYSS